MSYIHTSTSSLKQFSVYKHTAGHCQAAVVDDVCDTSHFLYFLFFWGWGRHLKNFFLFYFFHVLFALLLCIFPTVFPIFAGIFSRRTHLLAFSYHLFFPSTRLLTSAFWLPGQWPATVILSRSLNALPNWTVDLPDNTLDNSSLIRRTEACKVRGCPAEM